MIKKVINMICAASLMVSLTACGDISYENDDIYQDTESEMTVISPNKKESKLFEDEETNIDTITNAEEIDNKIQVPVSVYMCNGKHYSDVVKLFENAGFTNVSAIGTEGNYNIDDLFEGYVIEISVDDDVTFDETARYESDAHINIKYAILPKETVIDKDIYISEKKNSNNGVTVPEKEEIEGDLVWVPVNGGTKYHSKAGCSNMIEPIQVSEDTALNNGYSPCKRCH